MSEENQSKSVKSEDKTVSGPKGSVATFVRPRDGQRIWVYARKGETAENAIKRVMKHNGAEGVSFSRCQN